MGSAGEGARTALYLLGLVFLTVAHCQYRDTVRNPLLLPELGRGFFHAVGWAAGLAVPLFFMVGIFVLVDWRFQFDHGVESAAKNLPLVGGAIAVSTFAWGAQSMIPARWRDGYGAGITYLGALLGGVCIAAFAVLR